MMVILALPLVCGLMAVVIYVVIVGGVVSALPNWAQTPAVGWMMDIPQGSDYIPGSRCLAPAATARALEWALPGLTGWITAIRPPRISMGFRYGLPSVLVHYMISQPWMRLWRAPGYGMNGGVHNGWTCR